MASLSTVTPTLVTDTKPLRLSWTRLRSHSECPAKGELVARRLKSPLADSRGYFHGNVTDQCMRRFLSLPDPGSELGWMRAQVDTIFDEMEQTSQDRHDGVIRWRHSTDREEVREFCRELVTRLEAILARYCLPFDWTPAWRFEVPLSVQYGGCMRKLTLAGETDLLVFDNQGRVIVWDLKATKDDSYWRKTLAQLAFYAIAVKCSKSERLGRWPMRCGLIQPMCKQQVMPVDVMAGGGQAIREMAGRIQRTAIDIWENRLDPKPNDWCSSCEVKHACRAWTGAPSGGQVRLVA
jgi:PD-(D/E)XK nuclease superfamily protein